MAITLPGTGQAVATEDIGGEDYQFMKLADGRPGSTAPITPDNPLPVTDDAAINLLRILANLLMSPQAFDSALNRYRETCIIESGTITTVSSVTTVSTVTAVDGRNGAMLVNAMDHTAWALNVRACIT